MQRMATSTPGSQIFSSKAPFSLHDTPPQGLRETFADGEGPTVFASRSALPPHEGFSGPFLAFPPLQPGPHDKSLFFETYSPPELSTPAVPEPDPCE